MKAINRRNFLKTSALAGASVAFSGGNTQAEPSAPSSPFKKEKVRIAMLGVGLRGQSHVSGLLKRSDCEVPVVCDISDEMLRRTFKIYEEHNQTKPKVYKDGERDFHNLLAKEDIDAVMISTPWRWHTEMAVAAMNAGKYVGMEVSGGFSLDECWQLVNTYEATSTPLFFLENVCYRRDVMAVLQMVRENLFGELVHLEGGYQHDLRGVKFNDGKTPYNFGAEFGEKGFSEAKWRTHHSVHRNGDLYPTHGLGPLSNYLNLNRGNRLVSLTAMASKARGLHEYIVQHAKGGADHPNARINFQLGDKVTTLIRTSQGETLVLHHDTNLPRPYSLGFRVQGTKGLWMDVNNSLYVEGTSEPHRWESADSYLKKYDHPLWKKYEEKAVGAGHGGMDFFLRHAFVECVKRGETPPLDVYDVASWLAVTPLSEQSIAMGGQPMAFPDFTRGRWITRTNSFALSDDY